MRHQRHPLSRYLRITVAALISWCCLAVVAVSTTFASSPSYSDQRWNWPTGVAVSVTRPFDPPPQPWLSGHRGVDLRLTVGKPVFSPTDGTVIYAGTVVNRNLVSIEHGEFRTSLEPVKPAVAVGQYVERGEMIGYLEASDMHDGLHWGVRLNQVYVDPLTLLIGPIVLKPN